MASFFCSCVKSEKKRENHSRRHQTFKNCVTDESVIMTHEDHKIQIYSPTENDCHNKESRGSFAKIREHGTLGIWWKWRDQSGMRFDYPRPVRYQSQTRWHVICEVYLFAKEVKIVLGDWWSNQVRHSNVDTVRFVQLGIGAVFTPEIEEENRCTSRAISWGVRCSRSSSNSAERKDPGQNDTRRANFLVWINCDRSPPPQNRIICNRVLRCYRELQAARGKRKRKMGRRIMFLSKHAKPYKNWKVLPFDSLAFQYQTFFRFSFYRYYEFLIYFTSLSRDDMRWRIAPSMETVNVSCFRCGEWYDGVRSISN
jgi:hypothetical protein